MKSFPQLGTWFLASRTKTCLLAVFSRILDTLVDYCVEETHVVLLACIGAAFRALIAPVWWNHNPENIVYQVHLDLAVNLGRCRQRWRCINLNQPRLQVSVQQDVEAIQLKAVFIVDYYILHRF